MSTADVTPITEPPADGEFDFFLIGGWNYSSPDTPERFAAESMSDALRLACEEWADRQRSNGIRSIDGVFFPGWGDMEDDGYAVMDGEGCCALTRTEVLEIAEGGEIPGGW